MLRFPKVARASAKDVANEHRSLVSELRHMILQHLTHPAID
jgi:hypothetical protein